MPVRLATLAASAALLASACMPDEPVRTAAGGERVRECFWPHQVTGFSRADRDDIFVHVGAGDTYRFETLGPCPDLDFTMRLGLQTRGSSTICSGLDVDLVVPGPAGPRRCPVRMIHKVPEPDLD